MYIYIWYSKSKTFFIIDVSAFVFLKITFEKHKLHLKNTFIIFYVTIKTSYRCKSIGKNFLYNIKLIITISY